MDSDHEVVNAELFLWHPRRAMRVRLLWLSSCPLVLTAPGLVRIPVQTLPRLHARDLEEVAEMSQFAVPDGRFQKPIPLPQAV